MGRQRQYIWGSVPLIRLKDDACGHEGNNYKASGNHLSSIVCGGTIGNQPP